jgi:hypothetical protein
VKEIVAKLRNAAKEIEVATKTLDRSEEKCKCCGTMRRLNWDEYQMALELDAIVRKLRAFANKQVTND